MLRPFAVLGALGFVLLAVPTVAQATANAVVETTSGGVTGPPSAQHPNETLPDAVAYVESQGGGAITFAPGLTGQTITLTTGLAEIGATTTITGPSGGTVTISGGGTHGIFSVASGTSLTVSNLTLTDGIGTDIGGNIFEGGAIFGAKTSTLVIEDSTITGNRAHVDGGGVAAEGSLNVQNSTLSNNSAEEGGAIWGFQTTMVGSTVSGNSAPAGGGIFSASSLTISDSTFMGNDAPANGTEGAGGAILAAPASGGTELSIASSTIVGNQAGGTTGIPAGGGGIWADAENPAQPVSLVDTIVAGNSAGQGADIRSYGGDPQTGATFSLIGNPSEAGLTGATTTDLLGTLTTPLAPDLGPLQNNGGLTQTMLPLAGSPVIDAGKAPAGVTTDQRGDPRTVRLGFPVPSGGDGTDIGAVELQASEIGLPTVTAISPATATAATTVTITGTNLFPATGVLFGGTPAVSVTPQSATQITATVPAGVGTVDVRVISPAGESAPVAADRFTYLIATSSTTFGNQLLTLTAPSATLCVAPGGKLSAQFSSARIKGSKKTALTFKSVAFYIDRGLKHGKTKKTYGPNAISRHVPISESISLKGIKTGTHTLKVTATYGKRIKHGRKTKVALTRRTITTKFTVC